MTEPEFVPHEDRYSPDVPSDVAAREFFEIVSRRRTVREYDDRPVARETIEWLIRAAHSAPSGANKQPWRFLCVQDPKIKREIRLAAEQEEREFYARRANQEWLHDLAPLGTNEDKEFLEVAPWLIVAMQLTRLDDGGQVYYLKESVGLACGLLLTAAHHAGLATLTHTPSPMGFLTEVLGRPDNERPFLLIPVGYPAADCQVPKAALQRRPLAAALVVV